MLCFGENFASVPGSCSQQRVLAFQARCVFVVFCAPWFALPPLAADEIMDASSFRAAYLSAAPRLEERYRNMRVVGTLDAHDGKGHVEFRALGDSVLRVTRARGAYLLPEESTLPRRNSLVLRIGEDYRFFLRRDRDGGDYVLASRNAMDRLEPRSREHVDGERSLRIDQFLKAPFVFYGKPIRDWLSRDDFQINSVVGRTESGSEVVDVRFNMLFPNGRRSDFGRFVFLPHLGWALKESEVRVLADTARGTVHASEGVRLSYDSLRARRDAFPDVVEVFQKDVDSNKGKVQSLVVERVEYGTVRPEELTLAAFGLPPDPDFERNPPTPPRWWLWAALGGGALLALAAGFVWLRQRARR